MTIMNLALAAFLGVCLVPVALLGSWILYPVNEARMRLRAPTQFLLTDFFWLMTLFQLALAFTTQFVPKGEPEAMWLILLFLLPALTLIWAAGVNFLSQAGVRAVVRRGLFQVLLLSGTLLVMIGLPFLFLLTLVHTRRDDIVWSNPLNVFVLAWSGVALSSILLRLLSQWFAGWSWNSKPAGSRLKMT